MQTPKETVIENMSPQKNSERKKKIPEGNLDEEEKSA